MANIPDTKIDFVIPWVDGNDPAWQEEFHRYSPDKKDVRLDLRKERYRDTDLLRYWFRGIEQNAPWVHRIFFITNGQKPEWLHLDHPKLVWVKHADYIPAEYLPTFSSHPIELHLHRIKELSEHFVYFNDDMYLLNPAKEDFFFNNGLPCDYAFFENFQATYFGHILINDMIEINKHFNRHEVLKNHLAKYCNLKYPFRYNLFVLRKFLLSGDPQFPNFKNDHQPQPFLKQTFQTVWEKCEDVLLNTSRNRIRSIADVNQYLFKYWQLASGNFNLLTTFDKRKYYGVNIQNIAEIGSTILKSDITELCLNDTDCPDSCYIQLRDYFNKKFPDKSSFELE